MQASAWYGKNSAAIPQLRVSGGHLAPLSSSLVEYFSFMLKTCRDLRQPGPSVPIPKLNSQERTLWWKIQWMGLIHSCSKRSRTMITMRNLTRLLKLRLMSTSCCIRPIRITSLDARSLFTWFLAVKNVRINRVYIHFWFPHLLVRSWLCVSLCVQMPISYCGETRRSQHAFLPVSQSHGFCLSA